jgi:hypothetical protein
MGGSWTVEDFDIVPAPRKNRMSVAKLILGIMIVDASLALLFFAAIEVFFEFPVNGWLYLIVTAMFAAGLLSSRAPRYRRARLVAFAAICLVVALLYGVPWTSRNGFLKRLYSIRPGMTKRDARAVMAGYMEGTGWPANPFVASHEPAGELAIEGALVFRHSDDPAYNSDWGIVHFRHGRVTEVEFSGD